MSQFKPIIIRGNKNYLDSESFENLYNWKHSAYGDVTSYAMVRRSSWQYYLGVF